MRLRRRAFLRTHRQGTSSPDTTRAYRRRERKLSVLFAPVFPDIPPKVGAQRYAFDPITGYLVGTVDRFNDGKRAEVEDRVKHGGKEVYL